MIREELVVTNPKGIHARPSSLIVGIAQSVDSSVRFVYGGETFAADNIMEVLSMGAEYGRSIEVIIDGRDEEEALAKMKEIFALNFSDED